MRTGHIPWPNGRRETGTKVFWLVRESAFFFAWTIATMAGLALGSTGIDPVKWGIDFSFTAIFIFLATGMWQGKKDVLPWIIAGATALAAARFIPGKWYILVGSLAGSMAGALIHER